MPSARSIALLVAASVALPACSPATVDEPVEAAMTMADFALPADPDGEDGYDPIERYEAMAVPADNPITLAKALLGRQLYYDTRLSGDGNRSCYGCHVCEHGLTDGRPTAVGAFEKPLTRSAPTMWNVGYLQNLYWDGRAGSLEAQAGGAWKGGNMGAKGHVERILAELNAIPVYRGQFEAVFGGAASETTVQQALATYMRTIIAEDSDWDRWQAGDESAMSDSAKRGWELFQSAGCAECHNGVLFTDQQFHNVGIGMDAESPDVGRYKITEVDKDMGAFKTPTLRDVARSAPYFHDGSVATLEEAVRLMAGGGHANPQLSDKLKATELSDGQVMDLLTFLHALSEPCDVTAPELP
jgi:cytochrome c peroxidase